MVRMELGTTSKTHAVNAIVEPPTVPAPVTEAAVTLLNIAASQGHHRPVGILGALGDDVNHSIDGVRSPNGAARPTNHLNALNVLQRSGLNLPINTRKKRRVNAPSVDQYEQFAGDHRSKPAYAHRPVIRVDLCHFSPWRQAEDFGNVPGARPADILLGNDKNGSRRLPDRLGLFGRGRNFDVAQIYQAKLVQGFVGLWDCLRIGLALSDQARNHEKDNHNDRAPRRFRPRQFICLDRNSSRDARRVERRARTTVHDKDPLQNIPALTLLPSSGATMSKLKLTVNETKTRVCYLPEEKFDFLGYTFGRCYSMRRGRAYLGTVPSKKRVQRICRAISDETGRDKVWQDSKTIVERLNRMLIGWANYFCLGSVSKAYSAVDMHAHRRLRRWLCDKHKEPRPGYKRFPEASLNSVYGLVQLPHRTANLPWAKA
jgi:Group II intron, maturase-specific domain